MIPPPHGTSNSSGDFREGIPFPPMDFSSVRFETKSRIKKISVITFMVVVIAAAVIGATVFSYHALSGNGSVTLGLSPVDMCSNTPGGRKARSELVYTKAEFMGNTPVKHSDTAGSQWCIIGVDGEPGMWWSLVYVGDTNPLYRVMVAENGDGDHATRAVVVYRGLPPVKFARSGWIGFITPSEDSWDVPRVTAATVLLGNVARSLVTTK